MKAWKVLAAAVALLIAAAAHAGRSCEEKQPSAQAIVKGLALAQKTSDALDATRADVVLLARAGQDLSKWNLRYSHMGFAYRDRDEEGRPAWRIVHKLNQCGTAESALYRQGLGEFFLDDPWRYEAAWSVPSREVQTQLLPLLRDNARVQAVHIKPYSIVSYAWGSRYQQSNQWALETLAVAMQPDVAPTRANSQAWLATQGYAPAVLRIDAFTRLGARITRANVAFDDHPGEKRFSDRIETVTVESVFDWMQRTSRAGAVAAISLD